jgi:hypothetical protein
MLVKRIGEATALEVRATGIPYVFAPCVAVIDNHFFACFNSILMCLLLSLGAHLLSYMILPRFVEIQDGDAATKATAKTQRWSSH